MAADDFDARRKAAIEAVAENLGRKIGATSKGHIRGVPFVDDSKKAAAGANKPNAGAQDVNFSESKGSLLSTEFYSGLSREDWIDLTVNNTHRKADRAMRESTYSFAMAMISIVLNIVVIAHYLSH